MMAVMDRIAAVHRIYLEARDTYTVPPLPDSAAEWFAGSKTVCADGRPRPLYHGTDETFDQFSASAPRLHCGGKHGLRKAWARNQASQGIYFSADPFMAAHYGRWMVIAYLQLRNPFHCLAAEDIGNITPDRRDELEAQGFDGMIHEAGVLSEFVVFEPSQIRIAARHPTISYDPEDMFRRHTRGASR